MVIGARTACEEFCHAGHGRMGTVMGPQTQFMERLACHYLYIVKYPTGESEEIHLQRLNQVFGEPATILYNKCTGTIDIGKILEDCKDPDEVSY